MEKQINFREIRINEEAQLAATTEIAAGRLTVGPFVEKVELEMEKIAKAKYTVATSSCTMALKIALDSLGIKPGDFVVVPDITFVVCASVVMELGAHPIFVDVDPTTLLLDQASTVRAVTHNRSRIKAIIGVRLGGEPLPEWLWGIGVPVIIDSAHSMDPHDPRAKATCYSFHPTKIVSGIEGGMIATDDADIYVEAGRLRNFGFRKGTRIAKERGYKGNMTNVSACLIHYNLGLLEQNLKAREAIRDRYNSKLGKDKKGLGMYMISLVNADKTFKFPTIRHYPVPLSEMFCSEPMNPQAKFVADNLVSLPFHEHMAVDDVDFVCDTLLS